MKRTDPEQVGDLVKRLLRENDLDGLADRQLICSLWPEIVGQGINRYTTRRWVDGEKLHVVISSAALKNELTFHRERLTEALNRGAGKTVISDVVIH
ncbi:MAG: DUF721 domain-containing protein [Muribaculaceae bacterium]|jgi:Protein of unknown function (DUF721).|nr:DUF721 domain-containing protein [Muribaculaceae bacterium]